MTDLITIGTEKQIAYARSIFAKRGNFIREDRAKYGSAYRRIRAIVGQKAPNGHVVDAEMARRAERLADALSGGAEAHAAYWIEDLPFQDILDRYIATGRGNSKMTGMGLTSVEEAK